ncbi:hypothetical protein CCM_02330 [Cordyceps militaris CM01]|uniref:Uncharacterized protein n=1 Tax=Cordyceps militaris (strain CM01) TaxID=983644 RepID=G3J927_CORMM|nr:uncharacterized protein CCM_02330 [Cordyceps militaris CM01]EGX94059.1 hypothetical protein CCM_02330 [Cordyceps militaris CM01]
MHEKSFACWLEINQIQKLKETWSWRVTCSHNHLTNALSRELSVPSSGDRSHGPSSTVAARTCLDEMNFIPLLPVGPSLHSVATASFSRGIRNATTKMGRLPVVNLVVLVADGLPSQPATAV